MAVSLFSSDDDDVFLIKLPRMIDRGALISRYSRTANLDIRDLYGKEFADNENRGADFYRRVFMEYGDESVAELVTAQMGLQNISNVATKVIEEGRVGLSFIEKSSRYVRYDRKVNGSYLYAGPEKIGLPESLWDLYEQHCNALFDLYSDFYSVLSERVKEFYPIENFEFHNTASGRDIPYADLKEESDIKVAEKSYASSVRAKVLDEIRFLLPASTLTNMGITGNGRSFISLLQRLRHYGIPETEHLSERMFSELKGEFPELIDASFSKHGEEMLSYLSRRDGIDDLSIQDEADIPEVTLVSHEDEWDAINRIIAMSVYPHAGDLAYAMGKVQELPMEKKAEYIKELGDIRENRRHKPGRAFETTGYTFQINTNYGAFRDFQRHRFISIVRKDLTTGYGYDTPEIISMYPELSERYVNIMELSKKVHAEIKSSRGPRMAQYVVPYAFRYPVTASLNFRELAYFVELRSTPQAHEDLRRIAVAMYDAVKKVHPDLAGVIRFADRKSYPLGRVMAESRKEARLRDMEKGKSDQ